MSAVIPPSADRITVEFPAGEGYRSVGRLVLGGLASRFELPIDRVEDLLLAAESLFLHTLAGATVQLEVEAAPTGLLVRMGPFASPRLDDPAAVRVLTPLVDQIGEQARDSGSFVELLVSAGFVGV